MYILIRWKQWFELIECEAFYVILIASFLSHILFILFWSTFEFIFRFKSSPQFNNLIEKLDFYVKFFLIFYLLKNFRL